jgi:transcriptional regulator with XRE-family HTH domain
MVTSRKPDDSDKARGRELAQLRKAAGMSQEQLASQLGISARQLSKYELGQNKISISRYEEALRILRRQKHAIAGFAESQASYGEPKPVRDALLLSLGLLQNDLDSWRNQMNSIHHQLQDRLKLCFEIAGRM